MRDTQITIVESMRTVFASPDLLDLARTNVAAVLDTLGLTGQARLAVATGLTGEGGSGSEPFWG